MSFEDVLAPIEPYGWVVVVSFVTALIATPLVRSVARRKGITDKPDGHLKPHGRPIAYLGGIAVYLGWTAGMVLFMPATDMGRQWMYGLWIGGGLIMLVGLADDVMDLSPPVKLLGQVLAGVVLLGFGVGTDIVQIVIFPLEILSGSEFDLHEWMILAVSIPCTIVLVVAASNSTNLLDGMDGLCSGVTGIISVMFLLLAMHLAAYGYSPNGDPVRIITSLAMLGAVLGFLPYNFPPATVFLGDAGSMLLGFFAAAMILMFGERPNPRWVLGALMIFGLPILDTTLALIRRIKLKRPIFSGDRSHLYDQLVDRGYSVRKTVAVMYALSIFYGLIGVSVFLVRTRYALPIYIGVGGLTLFICHCLGFLSPGGAPDASDAGQDEVDSTEA
jgi:UDP-GlcNAc:undecaprenyl-phosphate GlcNAc-1-phosphate transferase